jgi:molybdenum-dependent DNA-binding transcriptional regulator ModE
METISMSARERKRLVILSRVQERKLPLSEAAELLSVSYRQAKRLLSRLRSAGDAGLVHGLRGKASNRRGDAQRRERVLARYQEAYRDYGPTHASECLAEEGLEVAPSTLRAG